MLPSLVNTNYDNELSVDNSDSDDEFSPADLNYNDIISDMLLELREKYHVTQKAISVICEKVKLILDMDRKQQAKDMENSLQRNHPGFILDHKSRAILHCDSQFSCSFEKVCGAKALTNYVKHK